jgi:hypothetical protein
MTVQASSVTTDVSLDDSVFHPSRRICPPNDRTAQLLAAQQTNSTMPVFIEPVSRSAALCPFRDVTLGR